MKPLIFSIAGKMPQIHESAFIAPGAVVCGDVIIEENASIWYGCVLRGDSNQIRVGKGSNVQDGTIIHVDEPQLGGTPTLTKRSDAFFSTINFKSVSKCIDQT